MKPPESEGRPDPSSSALGSIQRIDEDTLLLVGQELNIADDQPDVANVLLHRVAGTLVIIDTGATEPFREALRDAAAQLAPIEHIILLNTHGHPDHVGNNGVIDELGRSLGASVEHWLPARDVAQMRDPVGYWERTLTRITGVVALPAPPALASKKIVSLFRPLLPFTATTKTYEQRPLELFSFGPVRVAGWSFADRSVRVVRSQGHCAGHVVVFLTGNRLLHLGDEANGPCGAMADADQVKIQTTLGLTISALESGDVETVTEGHSVTVRRGAVAHDHYAEMLDRAAGVQSAALDQAAGRGVIAPAAFSAGITAVLEEQGSLGPNPNPTFVGMMAVNVLDGLGYSADPRHADHTWSRPDLVNPDDVTGRPHGIRLIPAAAAMAAWRLRGRDQVVKKSKVQRGRRSRGES